MDPLVSVEWLAGRIGDPRLRVFDATVQVRRRFLVPTVRAGRREWRRAHIPGSGFADLFALSDRSRPKRSLSLPSPEWFAGAMGALGVSNDCTVVVYDRRENMWAARLWWMLRVFGFDDAAVLDGGWSAWCRAGRPVCSAPCGSPAASFHPSPRPDLVVSKEQVLADLGDPDVILIDALGRRQHRGEANEYGRRGHIPGSGNVTAWEILDRDTGRYRPIDELRRKVGPLLDAKRVITYCGAGAAAASLANVLVRLGRPDVAVYDGGLMEWCADPRLPLEVGP